MRAAIMHEEDLGVLEVIVRYVVFSIVRVAEAGHIEGRRTREHVSSARFAGSHPGAVS